MSKSSTIHTDDGMVRRAVRQLLAERHADDDAVVVEELRAARGSARMDLAVVNGRLSGVEIKSDRDRLGRLKRQADLFSLAADRMTLVVGRVHHAAAVAMVPDWWGIMLATAGENGNVRLKTVRPGRLNRATDSGALVRLLEREELVALLEWHGLDRGFRTAPYAHLVEKLVSSLSRPTISDGVRRLIKARARIEKAQNLTAFGKSAIICRPPSV
ncbi:sce7726 family protein [Microvirga sp. ACRRW]|uniref:sce7726 family protein n=1 Tax=Microvirga sp. ACRRW TaxID=2918205 RepID=UPI00351D3B9B